MALNQVGLERLNTATTKKIGTTKNLIINGAMQVAQRGTSSTSTGYHTVDRFRHTGSGTDEAPTFAQVDVASGTTPYTSGFRKAFRITNGNQTGGAGAGDAIVLGYKLEAQDLANSGWNYVSSSSYITLSFWVKSSVAQNFYGRLTTTDGTSQNYPFETGSLTADTWTKITKTIPGNSNLQFDNNADKGIDIEWMMFRGTNFTDSGVTLNAWAAYASGTRTPDNTTTWYTTDDATFEITGVQLEVGSVATDFEHRSFGQELALCQRYFFNITGNNGSRSGIAAYANSTSSLRAMVQFPVPMRALPTFSGTATAMVFDSSDDSASFNISGFANGGAPTTSNPSRMCLDIGTSSMTAGQGGQLEFRADNGELNFSSEI